MVAAAGFLGESSGLVGVDLEECFVVLDVVDADEDVTRFDCRVGDVGVGFVLGD